MSTSDYQLTFDEVLLQPGSLETRIGGALDRALEFMHHSQPSTLIDHYLAAAGGVTLNVIKHSIICMDHAGLITPAKVDARDLNAIADRHGFTENHKTFPSVIVASELTALNGGVAVPTQIFRGSSRPTSSGHHSCGIEMFVPDTEPETVVKWISRGIGTHVAFRVKERSDVHVICRQLSGAGFHIPTFMHGRPMANTNDGTFTVYFDLTVATRVFRLEFFHRAMS